MARTTKTLKGGAQLSRIAQWWRMRAAWKIYRVLADMDDQDEPLVSLLVAVQPEVDGIVSGSCTLVVTLHDRQLVAGVRVNTGSFIWKEAWYAFRELTYATTLKAIRSPYVWRIEGVPAGEIELVTHLVSSAVMRTQTADSPHALWIGSFDPAAGKTVVGRQILPRRCLTTLESELLAEYNRLALVLASGPQRDLLDIEYFDIDALSNVVRYFDAVSAGGYQVQIKCRCCGLAAFTVEINQVSMRIDVTYLGKSALYIARSLGSREHYTVVNRGQMPAPPGREWSFGAGFFGTGKGERLCQILAEAVLNFAGLIAHPAHQTHRRIFREIGAPEKYLIAKDEAPPSE